LRSADYKNQPQLMPKPFNANAQKVIRIAQQLAEQGDGVVSPVHVLSALLAAAPQVWEALPQVNADEVRARIAAVQGTTIGFAREVECRTSEQRQARFRLFHGRVVQSGDESSAP
jgi:hypothetical protein